MARDFKIKLGSVLTLDADKEADLVAQIDELRGSHRLGDFIALCIRACYEKPAILAEMRRNLGMDGIHKGREEFFDDVSKQVAELKRMVNDIYDMAFKTYTMAQCGKRIGLSEKSDNLLLTSFILKKQLDDISNTLGIEQDTVRWVGSDEQSTKDKVDKVVELVIESYSGDILSEVVKETQKTVYVETEKVVIQEKPVIINQPIPNVAYVQQGIAGQPMQWQSMQGQPIQGQPMQGQQTSTIGNASITNNSQSKSMQLPTQANSMSDSSSLESFESTANFGALSKFLGDI